MKKLLVSFGILLMAFGIFCSSAFAKISDTTNKITYNGNGVTRNWDFTFTISTVDGSDIKLYKTDTAGALTEITSNYSVNVNNEYVTYPTVVSGLPLLATGEKITLAREELLTQETDWKNGGPFYAEDVEKAVDKLTMIAQQYIEELSRCVKFPIDETPTSTDTEAYIEILSGLVDDGEAARDAAVVAKTAAETAEGNAETAETNAGLSAVAALSSKNSADADSVQTAADRVQTGLDKTATSGYKDTATTQAGIATTKAGEALASKNSADADAVATAADRVQTGLDKIATAADRVQTGLDVTAANNYAAALKATSTSSIAIATGSKTFTIQSGKQFAAGQFVLISSDANSANYMHGQVTSYSSTTLVVNVLDIGGSGTFTDWTISVSGSRGTQGPTGSISIVTASGTVDAITADYSPDISLADLTLVAFVASGSNTSTTPTFSPDGLTAHAVTKQGGSALLAGDIPAAGYVALVEYNLANTRWELLNPSSKAYADTKASLPMFPGLYQRDRADKWALKAPYSTAVNRYTISSPTLLSVAINGNVYYITSQTEIDVSNAANWDTTSPTNYTTAANRAGKDFYIYACVPVSGTAPKILLSASTTYPSGYSTTTSRKIGGFHGLCVAVGTISGHTLTDFVAGDVLPASIWDLNHRPVSAPEGMVYSEGISKWVDIYLASGTGTSTASVYGATITDTRDWNDFTDDGGAVKKKMLTDPEFQVIATGSNEATNINGAGDPGTTGGHIDTASRRMISNIGVEDACGALWQWLDEQTMMYDAAVTAAWYDLPGDKGQLYRPIYSNDVKLIAGGNWGGGVYCGSRGRVTSYYRWDTGSSIGCRFCAEPV